MNLSLPDDWTPEQIEAVANVIYAPNDQRLEPDAWDDYATHVRAGQLRMYLRNLALGKRHRNEAS